MFSAAKCIKTGCDVACDGKMFHGDLMHYNGILILTGVPRESYYTSNCPPHFHANNIIEIYGCGEYYQAFIVEGISNPSEDFMNQIKTYETQNIVNLFEKKA